MLASGIGCHRPELGIGCVLLVHHRGHPAQAGLDLLFGDDAVAQPVRQQLAGDAQRGAVFHQRDVVDVGHLGAADACVDPAHDVAEDRLAVVVDLFADLLGRPGQLLGQRDGQQLVDRGARSCPRAPSAPRRRRPGGSASRAGWPRSATAPTRWWRPPSAGRSSARPCRPSARSSPTCPCRSAPCRRSRRPDRRRRWRPRRP